MTVQATIQRTYIFSYSFLFIQTEVTAQTISRENDPTTIETTIVNDYFSVVAYQFTLDDALNVFADNATLELNALGAPVRDPTFCTGVISSANSTWINTVFPSNLALVKNDDTMCKKVC